MFLVNSFIEQIFFEIHALSNTVLFFLGNKDVCKTQKVHHHKASSLQGQSEKKNQTTSYLGMYSIETLGCGQNKLHTKPVFLVDDVGGEVPSGELTKH